MEAKSFYIFWETFLHQKCTFMTCFKHKNTNICKVTDSLPKVLKGFFTPLNVSLRYTKVLRYSGHSLNFLTFANMNRSMDFHIDIDISRIYIYMAE